MHDDYEHHDNYFYQYGDGTSNQPIGVWYLATFARTVKFADPEMGGMVKKKIGSTMTIKVLANSKKEATQMAIKEMNQPGMSNPWVFSHVELQPTGVDSGDDPRYN